METLIKKIKRYLFKTAQLFQFLKLWWEDYWWDFSYLEKIIIWKLKQMAVNFWYKGHLESSKKKAREMVRIIQKFRKLENVLNDLYEEHKRKFPNSPEETFKSVPLPYEEGFFSLELSDEQVEYRKTTEGKAEEKASKKLIFDEERIAQKLRTEIYSDIGKQIKDWWD